MKKKHLISVTDFEAKDVRKLFELAHRIKKAPAYFQQSLQGKMFGLIFEKPSTRTWISFETGIFSLGGGTIYLGKDEIQLGVREEVKDVARVLNRYLAGVILRTFSHDTITEFEKYFDQPVINGLSDFEHPCQALADFFTLEEKFGVKGNPVISFVGDGNNVLNSLILLTAILGRKMRYATPRRHEPSAEILAKARRLARKSGAVIEGSHDPVVAVRDADVVYTDVWVSMGEEKQRKNKVKEFRGMQVNETLMKCAKKGALLMHCLPAHRGEEITDEVLESKNSIIFDQAENRLHVQKAILLHLCDSKK
ncbi:MAG: ornithine carbamoyltransferase [Candidatus Omnitrophica bacterium]|nr:ornithine carbamoyltransferase [Candidatus Omnitrophota bacterium]